MTFYKLYQITISLPVYTNQFAKLRALCAQRAYVSLLNYVPYVPNVPTCLTCLQSLLFWEYVNEC